jgi:transcription termination/antitermination protein NusA
MSDGEKSNDHELRDLFVRAMFISSEVADALIAHGFTSLEEIAYVPFYELVQFTVVEDIELLRMRQCARSFLENHS